MAILNLESNYYQFSSTDAVYTSMDAQDCEDRFKGPLESRKSPLSNQNTAVHELSKVAGEIIYISKAEVKGLSRVMLELSITKAKATLSYIHLLKNKATNRIWKRYFSGYIEQYVIADKVLRIEIVDLDSNDYGDSTTDALTQISPMSSHELSTVAYEKAMNTQLMTEHEVVRSQAIAAEVIPNESSSKPDSVASRAHNYVDATQVSVPHQGVTPNASELSKSQHSELISRAETQPEHTSPHCNKVLTARRRSPTPQYHLGVRFLNLVWMEKLQRPSTEPKLQMVTKTIWKPKHSQKESHPLVADNGKEIKSNEVELTTEMVMSKEKPPLDPGCSSNSEIGAAILRQPIHRLQDETQVTSISPVEVQVPIQLSIPTTSSNRFDRLEIEGGNLVVDLDYAATSCDHNHREANEAGAVACSAHWGALIHDDHG
ncbi:unnamed protein product [Ilex paraguariensis]|uniref:Uncharacterized protein n=1 Tax=Ilex paraguariensis TaxID=185542 RepID=A0ABC8RNH3_9AQUA